MGEHKKEDISPTKVPTSYDMDYPTLDTHEATITLDQKPLLFDGVVRSVGPKAFGQYEATHTRGLFRQIISCHVIQVPAGAAKDSIIRSVAFDGYRKQASRTQLSNLAGLSCSI